jgi:hypothetical protein
LELAVGVRASGIPTALACVVTTGWFGATAGAAAEVAFVVVALEPVVPDTSGWPAEFVAPAVTSFCPVVTPAAFVVVKLG